MNTRGKRHQDKAPRPQRRGATSIKRHINPENNGRLAGVWSRCIVGIKKNRLVLRSCIIFAACLGISILIYSKFIDEDNNILNLITARVTGAILTAVDNSPIRVDGTLVSSGDFAMRIVALCTGIVPAFIFISSVLAYPCKIKHKISGVIIGITIIYFINLVRLVTIFYIGRFVPGLFDVAHGLIWQAVSILLIAVMWLFWAEKLARDKAA